MERDVDWQSQNDAALFSALRERNEEALRELIARYSSQVYALCRQILKIPTDAEEVTADVFSELWQRSQRYDASRASGRTYILLLARSRSLDRIRAVQREKRRLEQETQVEQLPNQRIDSPEQTVHLEDLTRIVRGGLDELSESQRKAIKMAFFDGMSHPEIATALKAPLGSVKSHIRRGLMRLRDIVSLPESGGK
jgi:RNA polymerase sigma-70 factor (ECF subfamily)